jgi:hypothetical protein
MWGEAQDEQALIFVFQGRDIPNLTNRVENLLCVVSSPKITPLIFLTLKIQLKFSKTKMRCQKISDETKSIWLSKGFLKFQNWKGALSPFLSSHRPGRSTHMPMHSRSFTQISFRQHLFIGHRFDSSSPIYRPKPPFSALYYPSIQTMFSSLSLSFSSKKVE